MDAPPRAFVDRLGRCIAAALERELHVPVELGAGGRWHESELQQRPHPVRAVLVRYGAPLRDVMVVVSNQRDEVVEPLARAAAEAVRSEVGIDAPGDGGIELDLEHEYESIDVSREQLDGFYNEPTVRFAVPNGELVVILGTGLLASADALVRGVPDPLQEGIPADSLTPSAQSSPAPLDDARQTEPTPMLSSLPGPVAAELPDFSAPLADSASANADAATDTARWTHLLSGVEVEVSAELGSTHLALGDIASLVADSVLTLDQVATDPVDVFVNGTHFATARLVVIDGEYGIEILEVLAARGVARAAIAA